MPSTGLNGPFDLTKKEIDANVSSSIGAYALGYVNKDDTFIVKYAGRDDVDINRRLKDWIGKYESFKYGHFTTKKAAFEKECAIYHDFKGLDNEIHPARPDGTSYACPNSKCTDLD